MNATNGGDTYSVADKDQNRQGEHGDYNVEWCALANVEFTYSNYIWTLQYEIA